MALYYRKQLGFTCSLDRLQSPAPLVLNCVMSSSFMSFSSLSQHSQFWASLFVHCNGSEEICVRSSNNLWVMELFIITKVETWNFVLSHFFLQRGTLDHRLGTWLNALYFILGLLLADQSSVSHYKYILTFSIAKSIEAAIMHLQGFS